MRTQRGNNNAYCQDNELSWLDWNLDRPARELLAFTRALTRLRRQHPVLRRRHFFQGRKIRGSEARDLTWFRPDGHEMSEGDWNNPHTRCLGLRLAGDAIEEVDPRGESIVDDTLLLLLNAHHLPVSFVLPAHRRQVRWEPLLDTRTPEVPAGSRQRLRGGAPYVLEGRSLALLRLGRKAEAPAPSRPRRPGWR
jgi:glycogen operon protein